MSNFEFIGDWSFNAPLNTLSKIDSDYWHFNVKHTEHTELLAKGLVPLTIVDKRDYNPEPLTEQIQAVDFIFSNEAKLTNAITEHFIKNINPFYVEACGENNWVPAKLNASNLGELLRITSIRVTAESKSDTAYSIFEFEYKGDEEHGIAVVLDKIRLVGFDGIGDLGFDIINKDLENDEPIDYDKLVEESKFGSDMVHKPLEKYGKFKPWQFDSTEDYFNKLLIAKENDKLKEEIDSNNWNINLRFPSLNKNLVDLAAYSNNIEAIEYLISKGADFSKSILECTDHYIKKDAIKCLVSHGANVDELNYWDVTPLHNEILNYVGALRNKKEEEIEAYKDKLQFYVSVGSNPMSCDKENNDYKSVLRKRWNEKYLIENDIFRKVEELIFPNQKNKTKWKFWKKN